MIRSHCSISNENCNDHCEAFIEREREKIFMLLIRIGRLAAAAFIIISLYLARVQLVSYT